MSEEIKSSESSDPLGLKYEWTYSLVLRVHDGWSGVYGPQAKSDQSLSKRGLAASGAITGGIVVAHNQAEALDLIKEIHAQMSVHPDTGEKTKHYKEFELISLEKRGVAFD